MPSAHLIYVSRGSQADIKNHHHVPALGCPMARSCPRAGPLCHLSISCTLLPFTPFAQQLRIQPGHSLVIDSLFPRLSVLYFTLTVISLNSPHYQGGYSKRKGSGDSISRLRATCSRGRDVAVGAWPHTASARGGTGSGSKATHCLDRGGREVQSGRARTTT